jgi:hypothetical protein
MKKNNGNDDNILDLFYSLIANNIINEYIGVEEYRHLETGLFHNFYKIVEILINNSILNLNKIQNNILNLILKPELFYNKIIKKYGKITSKKFDIIIYSLRFILLMHSRINFYSLFFAKNQLKDFINLNYFPGTYMETDLFIRI